MSKRKPYNARKRLAEATGALLRTNYACIVDVEPNEKQVMLNWKRPSQIRSLEVVTALCDFRHRWTLYISVFCQSEKGELYSKSVQFTTENQELMADLETLIQQHHAELCESANPKHKIGSGWIAIPSSIDLSEEQANAVFKFVGAWSNATK